MSAMANSTPLMSLDECEKPIRVGKLSPYPQVEYRNRNHPTTGTPG
jgi:hypothetical protein